MLRKVSIEDDCSLEGEAPAGTQVGEATTELVDVISSDDDDEISVDSAATKELEVGESLDEVTSGEMASVEVKLPVSAGAKESVIEVTSGKESTGSKVPGSLSSTG